MCPKSKKNFKKVQTIFHNHFVSAQLILHSATVLWLWEKQQVIILESLCTKIFKLGEMRYTLIRLSKNSGILIMKCWKEHMIYFMVKM